MWCFIFFLVPVLSSPLVPLATGVQTTERPMDNSVVPPDTSVVQDLPVDDSVAANDNSVIQGKGIQNPFLDMASQNGFVQNLIKSPTLLSEFAKADPEVVNNIIDLLEGILEESRNLSATLTQDVADALLVKTAAESAWTTVTREKSDKQASIDGESEAIEKAIALIRTLTPGAFPQHNETGYRLFKMTAVSGFTDNAAGMTKYIAICHAAGYLPVGCGRDSGNYHCNSATRYQDEDCVELTGFCDAAPQIKSMTGWTPVITFQSTPASNMLYSSSGSPSAGATYIPVCGITV